MPHCKGRSFSIYKCVKETNVALSHDMSQFQDIYNFKQAAFKDRKPLLLREVLVSTLAPCYGGPDKQLVHKGQAIREIAARIQRDQGINP